MPRHSKYLVKRVECPGVPGGHQGVHWQRYGKEKVAEEEEVVTTRWRQIPILEAGRRAVFLIGGVVPAGVMLPDQGRRLSPS